MATKAPSKKPRKKVAERPSRGERAKKATAKKRTSKVPAKKATRKRASKAPREKASEQPSRGQAPAKKRASKKPAKSSRPTKPAKPRAKKAPRKGDASHRPRGSGASASPVATESLYGAPAPARSPVGGARADSTGSAPAPESTRAPSSRPPSYLEGVPQDHAELVSGLLQVVRGAAKDLKTLVTQAVVMSQQKKNPFDR